MAAQAPDADRRVDVLAAIAQRNAADAVRLARENAALRAQLAAERVHADARVAAVTSELDRLRAIPELRVGQRLRRLAGPAPAADAPVAPVAASNQVGGGTDSEPDRAERRGMGYPEPPAPAVVVLVRNRRRGIEPLLAWLAARGVTTVELVDNASSDPATVELLVASSRTVHRVDEDLGELAPWVLGVAPRLLADGHVLFVDGDTVPADGCPDDALARLHHELARHADADAVDIEPAPAPAGGSDRRPLFRLVRAGTSEHPAAALAVGDPYAVRCASWDAAADDPDERFARLCDAA
jgi:hypothetical protein